MSEQLSFKDEQTHIMSEFELLLRSAVPGPRLELGVFQGMSLSVLCQHNHNMTWGVDSFEGMGDPSPEDLTPEGVDQYPRGRLRSSYEEVKARFARLPSVGLIKGWVPEILSHQDLEGRWAVVHIDMDHYAPTKAAIDWCWDKMMPGGLIICDDYFPGKQILASRAISEIIAERRDIDGTTVRKCFWRF